MPVIMIQYLFLNNALRPSLNGTSFTFPSSPADAGFTRSFVPKKLIRKAATATRPNTQNVFVHAEASFPNFSTNGKVNVLIISVPAVASKFLKILNTDLSYGSCVISAFNAEYGTLIAV